MTKTLLHPSRAFLSISIFVTASILMPALSQAAEVMTGGASAGDGGKGVLCVGQAPQLLDLWEMRERNYARMIPHGGFTASTLAIEMKRIEDLAEVNYPKHSKFVKNLLWDAHLVGIRAQKTQGPLRITGDAPFAVFDEESKCQMVQLALVTNTDYRMNQIDSTLWNQMDAFDQAFLLIHESLQTRKLIPENKGSFDTTKSLRRFVGLLSLLAPTVEEKREFDSYF